MGRVRRRSGEELPSLSPSGVSSVSLPRAEPPEASGLGAWGESTGYRFRWKLDLGWERAEAENSQPKWDMDVAGIVKACDGWSLDSHNRPASLV